MLILTDYQTIIYVQFSFYIYNVSIGVSFVCFVKFFFGDNVSLRSPGYPGTLRSICPRRVPPSVSILKDFYLLFKTYLKRFYVYGCCLRRSEESTGSLGTRVWEVLSHYYVSSRN